MMQTSRNWIASVGARRVAHCAALGMLVSAMLLPEAAPARDFVHGVDFVRPIQFSVADQDAKLAELQSAGVRVIRFGMYAQDEDKNVDFIKRAHAHQISTVIILHGLYTPGAPERPYRPKEFPGMWPGPPLSALDPDRSAQYFQRLMNTLEAAGVVLAGLELENEINMAGNDPDFRLPGEGRVLGLADLSNDPEGQQVAKGYLQYLKVLEVLKQVRDHSKLNRQTPLLPTSLVDIEQEEPWPTPKPYDGVSVAATMAFFRAHGLDRLVDATPIPGPITPATRHRQSTGCAGFGRCSNRFACPTASHAGSRSGASAMPAEPVPPQKTPRMRGWCRR